ncbi:MarR family winged helix-turn-helix transcriptional regulator [Zhouia amylolytica]|uniref:MarR family winged helix-turn-helix transcriptional regulator n=1 Tax=Zhouia amylolytica TaxID=376730 RepID=UPI0020CC3377|nr:winged helix-turn-helix transcriptional regulator [Zhouia amylolytica]
MKLPNETIFYAIERAIKEYRRMAQKRISKSIPKITIDQAMVLIFLKKYPKLSQKELAKLVFKDAASVNRTIDLMTRNGYVEKSLNPSDKRRYHLSVTVFGDRTLDEMQELIKQNRSMALKGITDKEIEQVDHILQKIIENCNNHNG